ncbi:MAG: hypothetical protein Kow0013_15550 [Pararhodobacter sp.]
MTEPLQQASPHPITRAWDRLANRRCPDCGTRQPIYVSSRPEGRLGFIRGGRHVVPCPGCGLPLRLRDPQVDPHGIGAAIVFVVLFTGGVMLMVPVAARAGWSAGDFALAVAFAVVGLVLAMIGWSILRIRGREIVRADADLPTPPNTMETSR